MYARFMSDNSIKEEMLFCHSLETSMTAIDLFQLGIELRGKSTFVRLAGWASKTLPAEMRDVLNLTIKVVNFIKAGALNSRIIKQLCKDMESDHQALLSHTNPALAYFVDIFEALKAINLKLQGKNINNVMQYDAVRAFLAKLDLWKCRIEDRNSQFCKLGFRSPT
ncbi:zinc finger BED domain-containing protein 5-like [Homarus americanus]|uniref:zinc finger BED domain-containing protein 5-like n=1 Tax=Homarus americanus TaxID=6706 RepID=UPI001C44C10F|nr:zinc finger BED domain-containing protein 5-like [Homarus americanus]